MHDAELGLVYYNYRYYNPTNGRWTRRDPIGDKFYNNLYAYTVNKSTFYYDVLGLKNYSNFDGYHPTLQKCSFSKSCIENIRSLWQRYMVVVNRSMNFTNEWRLKSTKTAWEEHRRQFLENLRDARECIAIIAEQVSKGCCVPRPPELEEIPQWERKINELPEPEPWIEPRIEPDKPNPWVLAIEYATLALLLGNVGPQAATPEEIVTVPAAFIYGFIRALI